MNCKCLIFAAIAASVLLCAAVPGFATTTPVLGTAQDFAVLGASTVTNTGPTTLTGQASPRANLGVYPGTAITGLGSITFTGGFGTPYAGGAIAQQAQIDNVKAYNALALLAPTQNYSIPTDLGGLTLSPGIYHFDSSAGLTGAALTLNAGSDPNAFWVFQISSTLITGPGSSVVLSTSGGNTGSDVGVYWLVGSSATLDTTTSFQGNILALASISLLTNAQILNGRALAQTGAVTMDTNIISNICPNNLDSQDHPGPGFSGGLGFDTITGELVTIGGGQPLPMIPEPITLGGLVLGVGTLCGYVRRRARR